MGREPVKWAERPEVSANGVIGRKVQGGQIWFASYPPRRLRLEEGRITPKQTVSGREQ